MTNKKIQSLTISRGFGRFVQFTEAAAPDFMIEGTASKIYKNHSKKANYKKYKND